MDVWIFEVRVKTLRVAGFGTVGFYSDPEYHAFYEIPLDSISAREIRNNTSKWAAPRWVGVKYVTPEINDQFQELATAIAAEKNPLRVHLDAMFWGGR